MEIREVEKVDKLAEHIGCDKEALTETLQNYNNLVQEYAAGNERKDSFGKTVFPGVIAPSCLVLEEMCLSRLGQIVYGSLAFVSVGLILGSMFTPGWRQFKVKVNETIQEAETKLEVPKDLNMGLFPFLCQMPNNLTHATSQPEPD
uniref:Uncharacterized protein n=1 Tax=Ditylenchus dipsaci TaxID=166011 RepID=A0A915DT98_9BILA